MIEYIIFGRRDGDSMVTTTELIILYYMLHNKPLDICHAIALKFKNIATKFLVTIKIRGLMTTITEYYGFDMSRMDFDKVKRVNMIGISMMQSIRLVEHVNGNYRLVHRVVEQVQEDEEEEEIDEEVHLEHVVARINNLEIQVSALDVNVKSLTNEIKVLN